MKGSQVFLKTLKAHGNDTVYGVVGREAAEILFTEESEISFLTTRHETNAGTMADVVARITGMTQICFSTLGPGATNISTAIAGAYLDRSPIIAVAAQIESTDINYGEAHQCIDQALMMSAITKKSFEVYTIQDMVNALEEAYDITMTEPKGPVFISISIDVFGSEVDSMPLPQKKVCKNKYAKIDKVLLFEEFDHIFADCKVPAFIVGGQAIRCNLSSTLKDIAEKYKISVFSSYNAKGCINIDSKAWIGTLTTSIDRILSQNVLENTLSEVDVIVLIGYDYAEDLPPALWEMGKNKKVIRICFTENVNKNVHTDLDIFGDIQENLLALDEYLHNHCLEYRFVNDYDKYVEIKNPLVYDETYINVADVIRKINAFKEPKNIVMDVGYFRHVANVIYETSVPNEYICTAGLSSFGFGVGAALGVKYINKDNDVILISGDGGFHSHSQEMETFIRLNLPVTIILFNNSSFGLIKDIQYRYNKKFSKELLDFGSVDFCKLAEANRCDFLRINNTDEINEYFKNRKPPEKTILIEIMC